MQEMTSIAIRVLVLYNVMKLSVSYISISSIQVTERCQVQNNQPQDVKKTQTDATTMQDKRSKVYRCLLQSSDVMTV